MDHRNPPQMREQFRKELRARLMQQAPLFLTPRRENAWTALMRSTLLRPALAIGLSVLVLLAGAGSAAADSLPGDPAFALKQAFENVQVALTFDDVKRVELLGQIADRRLEELQQVAERDDRAPTASQAFADAVAKFRAAVDAVQAAAPEDKSTAVQELVDAAREKHVIVLDEVRERVSSDRAKDAIERAKDDEQKDTERENQGKGHDKTPKPSRTPARTPSVTPRPTPSREIERSESPRPSSARPSQSARP